MESLFNDEELSDIDLKFFDENSKTKFPAHISILENKSNYFRILFRFNINTLAVKNGKKQLKINIRNIGTIKSAIEIIQKFIYEDNVLKDDFIYRNINLLNFFLIDNAIYKPELLQTYEFEFGLDKYTMIKEKDIVAFKGYPVFAKETEEILDKSFKNNFLIFIALNYEYNKLSILPGEMSVGILYNFLLSIIPDIDIDEIKVKDKKDYFEIRNKNHIRKILNIIFNLEKEKNKDFLEIQDFLKNIEYLDENLEDYSFHISMRDISQVLENKAILLTADAKINFGLNWINSDLELRITFKKDLKQKVVNFLKTTIPGIDLDFLIPIKDFGYIIQSDLYIKMILRKLYYNKLIIERDIENVELIFEKLRI